MNKSILKLKKIRIWDVLFCVLLIFILIILSKRASDEYRWSDWGFGDAQTMLSLRNWNEAGWLASKLLFIPQGYAKIIQLFDKPPLRHHAHGICPISSPKIGPRLYYTHYPPGYLLPFAFIYRVGLDNISSMRILSIIISLGAVVLMYLLFSRIASPAVAFIAVLFYMLTPAFLGYADSLANQPIDDLLRFAFMYAIVIASVGISRKQSRGWLVIAWIIEFILSLSSFDSVFFIFLWLIAWDILNHRGFRWKKYLIFVLAPILAQSLLFLQNVWYLGLNDAVIDMIDTFTCKSSSGPDISRFTKFWQCLIILLKGIHGRIYLILTIFVSYCVYSWFTRHRENKSLPSTGLLSVLFLCGSAFGVLFPSITASMAYETRQIAPFVAVLIGGASVAFVMEVMGLLKKQRYSGEISKLEKRIRIVIMIYVSLSAIILPVFWYSFITNINKPLYDSFIIKNDPNVLLARKIKDMATSQEAVFYSLQGFQDYWNPAYVPGYPQIHPILEYYIGSKPILCFDNPVDLLTDLRYMLKNNKDKFSPVLVAASPVELDKMFIVLQNEGIIEKKQVMIRTFLNRFFVDLTDYLVIK